MQAAGFPCLFPDTWTVLGHRLRPLCIGHATLLEALESPFATWQKEPSGKVTVFDVLAAVEVCRRPWAEAHRLVTSHAWQWLMIWRHFRWGLWWYNDTIAQLVLSEKAGQIFEYVSHWTQGPECNSKASGRQAGAPYLRRLVTFLMAYLHLSEEAAMAMPLSEATWHFATYWETSGSIEIGNNSDRDLVRAAEAAAAAAMARARY